MALPPPNLTSSTARCRRASPARGAQVRDEAGSTPTLPNPSYTPRGADRLAPLCVCSPRQPGPYGTATGTHGGRHRPDDVARPRPWDVGCPDLTGCPDRRGAP